jgi:hypothetical protein
MLFMERRKMIAVMRCTRQSMNDTIGCSVYQLEGWLKRRPLENGSTPVT